MSEKLIQIFLMVNNMNEKDYFEQIGYELAMGYDKVGWMKVSEDDIQKYKAMTEEEIREDVEQWRMTGQWSYQVDTAIEVYLESKRLKRNNFFEKFGELEDYVIDGFVNAVYILMGE
jgi:hypothetical protein